MKTKMLVVAAIVGLVSLSVHAQSTEIQSVDASSCKSCVPSETTTCLLDGRFTVELTWKNAFFNPPTQGVGRVITFPENQPEVNPAHGVLSESALFSMFDHARDRVEVIVKVFKGVGINGQYWVFVGGLTNNEFSIEVTDTKCCMKQVFLNQHSEFKINADFEVFPLDECK